MTQRVTNQIVWTRRELTSESYPLSSTPSPWHVPLTLTYSGKRYKAKGNPTPIYLMDSTPTHVSLSVSRPCSVSNFWAPMILSPQLPECWDYKHVLYTSGAKGKKGRIVSWVCWAFVYIPTTCIYHSIVLILLKIRLLRHLLITGQLMMALYIG